MMSSSVMFGAKRGAIDDGHWQSYIAPHDKFFATEVLIQTRPSTCEVSLANSTTVVQVTDIPTCRSTAAVAIVAQSTVGGAPEAITDGSLLRIHVPPCRRRAIGYKLDVAGFYSFRGWSTLI